MENYCINQSARTGSKPPVDEAGGDRMIRRVPPRSAPNREDGTKPPGDRETNPLSVE